MRTKQVIVEKYNPLSANAFEEIKTYLYTKIPRRFKIIHIGSTSIKGLSAKPIIDIDIVYEEEKDKLRLIDLLTNCGYIHEGNLGIEQREAFGYESTIFMKHHLYVVKKDCKAYNDHMILKEYLIKHKDEKNQYGELKTVLAEKYPYDIDAYIEGKSPLIRTLLTKAKN